ncbi:Cytochrome P450 [Theobroma cacao]|uniref:Cytochrome P450 n=1 Tax=Theobroma cacao TaxID=3641 RepID=A0A061DG18_THECC|nr:Cytochrome P450 [Theobroma cacao]
MQKIPPAFVRHFYGTIPKDAMLKNHTGKHWLVDLEEVEGGLTMTNGWQGFASENSLEFGDFLIFEYDGKCLFDVEIFGRNGCNKAALSSNMTTTHAVNEKEIKEVDICNEPTQTCKQKYSVKNLGKALNAATYVTPKGPYFVSNIPQSMRSAVYVPRSLLASYGIKIKPEVVLLDQNGKKWPVMSKKSSTHRKRVCTAPQAGGALPVIGHMHLLGGHQLTHKTLGAMADKYGPVFSIRLGSHSALVLNSWEMARECFTVHDKVFSTRPVLTASKVLGYNYAMFGFAPYGSYWREIRRIATIELLSSHRIDMLKHIRASEVKTAVRELYKSWLSKGGGETGVLVDMKQWFGDLTHNIALRMVGGKRFFGPNADCEEAEARRCQKVMRDSAYLFGVFVVSDALPFIGWLDFQGYEKAMKRTAKELDILLGGWLEEHKQKKHLGGGLKKEQDFMDVMLNILEDAKITSFDADTINKATCLNLVLAGSDTTMITLTWALSLLLNNPRVLKRAQDELDMHVGKDRLLEESDIRNLVYLHAIVKETLRLYPPSPIIFRASMEDCTLSTGYHIPAGTRLMVNAWKIQRDERVWPDPHVFKPERFLTSHKDMEFRGQTFELIPFGSGRRSCPGVSLALQVVHSALASFLQSFEVSKPSKLEDIDMTESTGLTNLKATPLEVLFTPRLDSKLYGLGTELI